MSTNVTDPTQPAQMVTDPTQPAQMIKDSPQSKQMLDASHSLTAAADPEAPSTEPNKSE